MRAQSLDTKELRISQVTRLQRESIGGVCRTGGAHAGTAFRRAIPHDTQGVDHARANKLRVVTVHHDEGIEMRYVITGIQTSCPPGVSAEPARARLTPYTRFSAIVLPASVHAAPLCPAKQRTERRL